MARGTSIPGFAEKLKLALDRANLSRAQLAQSTGVDKSVVARWLAGTQQPGDHSFATLTAALVRHIDGFSRADWDLSAQAFAARLGITQPAENRAPTGMLADAVAWTAPDIATTIGDYAGLWIAHYLTVEKSPSMNHVAIDIYRSGDGLALRLGAGEQFQAAGAVFVLDQTVYLFGTVERPRRALGSFNLHGVLSGSTAVMMDGLFLTRGITALGPVVAGRSIFIRLADPEPDPVRQKERFDRVSALALTNSFERPPWPAPLFDTLRAAIAPDVSDVLLHVSNHLAWTRSVRELKTAPAGSPQREAYDWAHGLYAAALAGE